MQSFLFAGDRLKRLSAAVDTLLSSGSEIDRVVRLGILQRESGSVQDALAAGDQKPVLHVAEGFQEHIDSTEEGRAVLREAGFVHIDVSDDIGVASWQFDATPTNRVLLTDLLAKLSGTLDSDAALSDIQTARAVIFAAPQAGIGSATSKHKVQAEAEGWIAPARPTGSTASAGPVVGMSDPEDSGKPGGERFRSHPIDPFLASQVYQPGPVRDMLCRHITCARFALQLLQNISQAQTAGSEYSGLAAMSPDDIEKEVSQISAAFRIQFMLVAGGYQRYQAWAELLRGGLKPQVLIDEVCRVNPELRAVAINITKIQVLDEASKPLSIDALRSQSIQQDVEPPPGESVGFVRAGQFATGRKMSDSSAKSIVAMFQLQSARMESRLARYYE